MLAPTSYLGNASVFCILTIFAAVFTISLSTTLAHSMRAFFVLSHLSFPCFLENVSMVGLENQMVKPVDASKLVIHLQ